MRVDCQWLPPSQGKGTSQDQSCYPMDFPNTWRQIHNSAERLHKTLLTISSNCSTMWTRPGLILRILKVFGHLDGAVALYEGKDWMMKRKGIHGSCRKKKKKGRRCNQIMEKWLYKWARQNSSLGPFRLLKKSQVLGTIVKEQSKRDNLAVVTTFDSKESGK